MPDLLMPGHQRYIFVLIDKLTWGVTQFEWSDSLHRSWVACFVRDFFFAIKEELNIAFEWKGLPFHSSKENKRITETLLV